MLTVRGILLLVALAAPAHAQVLCRTCPLNTCDGAYTKYYDLISLCPGSMVGGYPTGPWTPASCGSDACKAVITSIDDNALSSMKTGFTATGCQVVPESYGTKVPPDLNYESLKTRATQCGHATSIVTMTSRSSFATHGAYVPGGFIHAVLCVVTLMVSSLGMEKY